MKITKAQLKQIIKEELSDLDPVEPAKGMPREAKRQKLQMLEKQIAKLAQTSAQGSGGEVYMLDHSQEGWPLGIFGEKEVAEKFAMLLREYYKTRDEEQTLANDPWAGDNLEIPEVEVIPITLGKYTAPDFGPDL
jgi:hypothetical protein